MRESMRPWAWLAVALVLNLAALDVGTAIGESDGRLDSVDEQMPEAAPPGAVPEAAPGSAAGADSSAAEPAALDPAALKLPTPSREPGPIRLYDGDLAGGEGTGAGGDREVAGEAAPVYKKWWFWTIIGGAATAAVIMAASGGEETKPDLPGFPNPPER